MAHGVPLFFEGPTQSRFYFIGGDHWTVRSDEDGIIASLRQKHYSIWRFGLAYVLIPGLIISIGIVFYFVTEKPLAFWGGLAAGCAAGLPMAYIHRTEQIQLAHAPDDIFVLRFNGIVEIQGETYKLESISDLHLEYISFQSTGAQGDAGYSELDIVFTVEQKERKINLLSQTSDWALKHARQLEQIAGIKLKRTHIAR